MPYKLTSQEKADLRRKYIANVERLNRYLPESEKLRVDLKWFNARINDPAEQRFYLKSKRINESVVKREKIADELGKKYKFLEQKGKTYAFSRGVFTDMLEHDFDPKVKKYNEVMMRDFCNNPDAYAQRRIQNALKLDAGDLQKFFESPDLKNHLLDFYERNEEIIDDCMNFKRNVGDLKKNNCFTPELLEHLEEVGNNLEVVSACASAARLVKGESFFTVPPLSEAQKEALFTSDLEEDDKKYFDDVKETVNAIASYAILEDEFTKTMKGFQKNHIDIEGPGTLSKYSGMIKRKNGEVVKMSPGLYFTGNPVAKGDEYKIVKLNSDVVKKINKAYSKDYIKETGYKHRDVPESLKWANDTRDTFRKEFVYAYATRERVGIGQVDNCNIGTLAEAIKGNWKESFFGTTSSQYKSFIKAMKSYDNENSRKYHNKRNVYDKANAYLIHKGVKTLEDVLNLPHPANKRARLCWEVMDSYEKSIKPTEGRYERGTDKMYSLEPDKGPRNPLFLNQAEVEDFEIEYEKSPYKQKEIKLNKDDVNEFKEIVDSMDEPKIK